MASIISAGTTSGTALNMAGDTSGVLQLATNGSTTAVTVDTSQNVGIGTTSPSVKLHLKGASFANAIRWEETGGSNNFYAGPIDSSGNFGLDNNSASGYTRFVTNSLERMRIDSSGNLQFNSGYGSVATAFGCRAWVNFNGTGVVAIRASGNVTSITDNSTGTYTVNFTTVMPDANYSYSHAYSNEANVQHAIGFLNSMSTSQLSVSHYSAANSANTADKSFVLIAVFR
jgi:hypothetical protein